MSNEDNKTKNSAKSCTVALSNDVTDETSQLDEQNMESDVYDPMPYRGGLTVTQKSVPPKETLQELVTLVTRVDSNKRELLDRRKKFMSSLRKKEVSSVEQQLEKEPELVEYTDEQGISILSEATKGGPKLLNAFLTKITERRRLAVWIEHALLYAISANNTESVQFLLDERDKFIQQEQEAPRTPVLSAGNPEMEKRKKSFGVIKWRDRQSAQSYYSEEFEDAEFPIYLTPVVLAAKLQRGDILKMLLERPNASREIHSLTAACKLPDPEKCEICRSQKVFKSTQTVEESERLLEIYKALSSPTYILNSGVKDPVLEAFQLSRKMDNLAIDDPSFKAEYDEIGQNCRQFAREMLALCRSTEEIETLLSVGDGYDTLSNSSRSADFHRVIVANSYKQKEFVAHPFCQQVVQRRWYGGLPKWVCENNSYTLAFTAYLVLWLVFWPLACVLYMFKLSPKLITFMNQPINKFINDTISFTWFLVLLTVECNNTKETTRISDLFTPIEIVIIIWVVGMAARQIKMIWAHRIMCRCNVTLADVILEWRWFDISVLMCFIAFILLRLISIISAYSRNEEDIERNQWNQWNCFLVAEGFFSLGTLLSFMKLVGMFKASSSLGPLQISLKFMINDILRFLFIFFITMTGFVMALTNIYSHYDGHMRIEEKGVREQADDLIRIRNSYKALFWALFGYGDPSVVDVVVDNTAMETGGTSTIGTDDPPDVVKHKVTEMYGYILYALYHIVAMIVLINMLIAMMAKSFDAITTNSDMEWKFARTKLQMAYFTEIGALPPPFNLVFFGFVIKRIITCCKQHCKCCENRYNFVQSNPNRDYEELISKLGKRYFRRKAKDSTGTQESETVSEN